MRRKTRKIRKRIDVKDYDRTKRGRSEHVARHTRRQDVRVDEDPSFSALGRRRLTRKQELALAAAEGRDPSPEAMRALEELREGAKRKDGWAHRRTFGGDLWTMGAKVGGMTVRARIVEDRGTYTWSVRGGPEPYVKAEGSAASLERAKGLASASARSALVG